MAVGKNKPKDKRPGSLSQGRPPLLKSQSPALSSKATRSLIRSHHTLRKAHAKAVEDGDVDRAQDVAAQIVAKGGLPSYQLASVLGQSVERGGDSSRLLVEWLKPEFDSAKARGARLRALEVGALSTKNACSAVDCLDVTRIDLQSRHPEIRQIDFMDLPVPETQDAAFHMVSLSLVLNFVSNAAARGDMLRRIPHFLRPGSEKRSPPPETFPCLFLVLPLPCVTNSRYLTEERLAEIMRSLGFVLTKVKKTSKLYYSLWSHDSSSPSSGSGGLSFRKQELRAGGSRNNFAIVLS